MKSDIIAELRAKQKAIAAERAELLARAEGMAGEIAILERAIAIFDPTQKAVDLAASPARKKAAGDGPVVARSNVLAYVRQAHGPILAHDIAADLVAQNGWNLGDKQRAFEKRVSSVLRGLKQSGLLVSNGADEQGRAIYARAA